MVESARTSPRDRSDRPVALSVVLACIDSARTIERSLTSLRRACEGIDAEVILVDASRDGTAELARRAWPNAQTHSLPPGLLIPQLWSYGLSAARGRIVAFTTGQCVVSDGWARALLDGLGVGPSERATQAGLGGPLRLARDTGPADWALFYLRFSAFLAAPSDGRSVADIPGDNAAYRREDLERHAAVVTDGFWEVELHRALRADGRTLGLDESVGVEVGPGSSFGGALRQRFAHGRHFGATRLQAGDRSRWRTVLAAPIVPLVMAVRVGRRAFERTGHRARFLLSLPLLLPLAASWAAGEAWGALSGPGLRTIPPPSRRS